MPAYNFIKKTAALLIFSSLSTTLFSQAKSQEVSVTRPVVNTPLITVPTVSEPSSDSFSMKGLSAPVIGKEYYNPGSSPSKTFEKQIKTHSAKPSVNNEIKTDSISLTKVLNSVSAKDLAAMNELGILDSLYQTDKSLEGLLENLSSLKEKNAELLYKTEAEKSFSTPAKEYLASETEEDSSLKTKNAVKPKILRFSINSYDILKTCKKIYISTLQEDGAFLVTGDRRYLSDGKNRSETFYLYFNLEKEKGTSNYSVTASVSQDYLNEYSFMYQLSKRKNLAAIRTGNLLTMHTSDANWQLDFLIDLGDE